MSGERRDFGLGLHRRDGGHPVTPRHGPVDIIGAARTRQPPSVRGADADAVADAVVTASRLLIAVSAGSIAAVDETITIPQFRLLVVLRTHGAMSQSMLADHLGVNPSTVNRMVERLIAADLVNRGVNPESRREVVLDLTGSGTSTVTRVTRQRHREIAGIVARMPLEQRAQLVEALEAFSEAGGEPPVDEPRDDWI